MNNTLFSAPRPTVNVAVLQVTAIVGPIDARADQVLRRAVPRTAHSRRPDGTVVVSLARIKVLVDALERAGYDVQLRGEGVQR